MTGWLLSKTDTGFVVFKEIGDARISYPFQTEEWARLCQKSMDSHDEFLERRKWWGVGMGTLITGYQNTLTGSTSLILSHFQLENKPIIVWDHNRQVVKLDVPEIIRIWIKTTLLAKAWKRLMWGTKGKE